MTECEFCEIIKKKLNMVYEDEQVYVMHSPKPAVPGHLLVLPRNHYMIIEQIPDYEVASIFEKVNKISIAVFEAIGAHGTNIMLQNGVAAGQKNSHLMIHIIPRRENDGLDFNWPPKSLSEEEMSTIELKIKDATANIGYFETEKKKPIEVKEEVKEIKSVDGQENMMIKQLERIP